MSRFQRVFNAYWEKLPKRIRNKFAMVTLAFVFWMAFLDRNSLLQQFYLQSTINELQTKKAYFLQEIKQAETDHHDLFTSDASMEKFARERYLMKKSNEDLFILVEEK